MENSRPVYKITNELSSEIVNREIKVLQGMKDLTSDDLNVDPNKFTPQEAQELIRHNTRNIKIHQEWLDLLRRVVPEDCDDNIRLLRDLHLQRLAENLLIIEKLQSASPVN